METSQCLSVDFLLGHRVLSRCHRHILVIPHHFHLGTDKRHNGCSIFFCTHDVEFVIHIQQGLLVGHDDVSVVQHSRTNEISADESSHLQDALVSNGRIEHLHRHQVGLHSLLVVLLVEVLQLFLKIHFENDTNEDDAADDAHDRKRVGASIAVSNDGHSSLEGMNLIDLLQGGIGGTKTRGVGHGSTQGAHQHGQVVHCRNDIT